MTAIDTNILIYAHRAETDLHESAAQHLIELAQGVEPWGLPVFCLAEFCRVVTHRRVFNPPSTLHQAFGFLADVVDSPTCRLLRPAMGFLELLGETARRADARGNLMFDAQLAALCAQHGIGSILTNDRDFARFDQPRPLYLSPRSGRAH